MDAASRGSFLDSACRGDPSLRMEVEALLEGGSVGGFLDNPAYVEFQELLEGEEEDSFVGKDLGVYSVTAKLGSGGMGIVYLAQDTRLDRPVAIKMLAPRYTSDPQQRERLKREARAAARLSHPGIATVYALEEYGDTLYMVSEYVRGDTLRKAMADGPVAMPLLMDIATQIARALAAAHEQGVVHRDLKPENVVRTDAGIVKILDFGLARFEPGLGDAKDARLTRSGVFIGTPAYASPEQLLGGEIDRKTDLFSFGVLLYEMASGRHPFGASDSMAVIARILETDPAEIRLVNPSVPMELGRIIRRCLQKKPEDRYNSTRDLLKDLEELAGAITPKTSPPEPARAARGRMNPFWWWRFHQAVAGFGYYAMLYPLWRVKQWLGGVEGSLYFFPAVVAVGLAANLRLHLWFTSRFYPLELERQRRMALRWIRAADCLFVFMLAASAVRIHVMHAIIATLLMGVAIYALVAFALIEPTTARAAFDQQTKP
jgi:hypothetical protein